MIHSIINMFILIINIDFALTLNEKGLNLLFCPPHNYISGIIGHLHIITGALFISSDVSLIRLMKHMQNDHSTSRQVT